MNKFMLADYLNAYCNPWCEHDQEYYENLVLQDILNGTASKGTIAYYNECKDVKQIIKNVMIGYEAELKVLNILNEKSNLKWKFIDEDAGYYRLGSREACNKPDFISDTGITVEVKNIKSYGYNVKYVEFKSYYKDAAVCYEHMFHNADYVIAYDRITEELYRFNKESFIANSYYTTNKFGNSVHRLNLTQASL